MSTKEVMPNSYKGRKRFKVGHCLTLCTVYFNVIHLRTDVHILASGTSFEEGGEQGAFAQGFDF